LSRRAGRRFGWTVGVSFLLLGVVAWSRHHTVISSASLTMGALLVSAGILVPTRLEPVERVWMAVAHAISRVTTPVAMAVVYLVGITPVGLLMRATGKDPLRHSDTGWIARNGTGRSDLERQF